jgi:hypothetical protein
MLKGTEKATLLITIMRSGRIIENQIQFRKKSGNTYFDDSGTGENPDDPNGGSPFSIENVQPSSAYTGDTITLQILLHGEMLPPSEAKPEIISIGTINGSNIDWNGSIATTTITIPTTEKIGAKDVTIQFPTPPDNPEPLIINRKKVFLT